MASATKTKQKNKNNQGAIAMLKKTMIPANTGNPDDFYYVIENSGAEAGRWLMRKYVDLYKDGEILYRCIEPDNILDKRGRPLSVHKIAYVYQDQNTDFLGPMVYVGTKALNMECPETEVRELAQQRMSNCLNHFSMTGFDSRGILLHRIRHQKIYQG